MFGMPSKWINITTRALDSEREGDMIKDETFPSELRNRSVEAALPLCGVRRNLAVPTALANPAVPNPFLGNSVVLPTVSESAEVHYGLVMHE